MKIGIIPNLERDTDLSATKESINLVVRFGGQPVVSEALGEILRQYNCEVLTGDVFEKSDIIAALGGDGTILRVAKRAAEYNKPVFGINLGRLGYLTDVENHQKAEAFEKVMSNRFTVEARLMLRATVVADDEEIRSSLALNDVCISKSVPSKMIELSIDIDGQFFERYRADGVIFSTPTGSTAYNLSAGGPILKPDAEMIAITPICPHTLYARSAVIPSPDVIGAAVLPQRSHGSSADAVITCDSDVLCVLRDGVWLKVEKAVEQALIVRTANIGFYERLRLKLEKN